MTLSDLLETTVKVTNRETHFNFIFYGYSHEFVICKNNSDGISSLYGKYDLYLENEKTGFNVRKRFLENL